jgi:hypothetical protein
MGQENEAEMGRSVDSTVTSDKPTGIERRALPSSEHPASTLIDAKLKNPGGWRGRLAVVRDLIRQAALGVGEEVKWRKPSNPDGVPVWSNSGIICTGETYKDKVKLTFAQGAKLKDPAHRFNASLDGGTRRAIDLREGDELDHDNFKALIRAAVALNAGD